ncbi:MAG TPA: hypothetical protein VGL57_00560 [Solirubrobacteraceae bacterium]|jgi:hypothetical protein
MTQLAMPANMGATIAETAQTAGAQIVETGGFLLGRVNTSDATVLALTGDAGVTRRKDLFQVSGLALSMLFEWADDHDLTVLAQWHSHRLDAFLSPTDLKYGLNVRGFQTTVIPYYQRPSSDPTAWGWWTFDGTTWIASAAPRLNVSGFETIVFEEGAVHES